MLDIESLLKAYRKHIPRIWDQTKYVASYLLIGKAFNNLITINIIARAGSSHELVEISRSAIESLDLAILFLEDTNGTLLKKWFKGEIIKNAKSRVLEHKIINDEMSKQDTEMFPYQEMKSDVYSIYSLYTHSSYAALLDSVDVFYEDFDYKKYSGFHYTKKYLHLVDNLVINILLSLKDAFIRCNDRKNVDETEKVFRRTGYVNATKEFIAKTSKRYVPKSNV